MGTTDPADSDQPPDPDDHTSPPTAVVLAAGRGTRMRSDVPKPLQPLAGRPVVLHVLHALRDGGVGRAVVVTGHGAEAVEAAVRVDAPAGPRPGLRAAAGPAGHGARGAAGARPCA